MFDIIKDLLNNIIKFNSITLITIENIVDTNALIHNEIGVMTMTRNVREIGILFQNGLNIIFISGNNLIVF